MCALTNIRPAFTPTGTQQFGLWLLPDLYEDYNPMAYADAQTMEVELGILLREAGFGVWQA